MIVLDSLNTPLDDQNYVRLQMLFCNIVQDTLYKGRDLGKVVPSRAVRWHLENHILVCQNKAVVFVRGKAASGLGVRG